MDVGCYGLHISRFLTGRQPTVTSAVAKLRCPEVDESMDVSFSFPGPNPITSTLKLSMNGPAIPQLGTIDIKGSSGSLYCNTMMAPGVYHYITLTDSKGNSKTIKDYGQDGGKMTYYYQLQAFIKAVQLHKQGVNQGDQANWADIKQQQKILCPTSGQDSIDNMKLLDEVYTKAGLQLRGN